MIYLAFYRGEGRFLSDTLVQRITRSEFSHCELFASEKPPRAGQTHRCISAAGKFGGVYERDVTFREDAYEFVAIPWAPHDTLDRAARHLGAGYDYWGLLMTQCINLRRHTADRWFCSKLCAKALGLADPHTYAPGDLKRIVEEHTRTYLAGIDGDQFRKFTRRQGRGSGAPVFPGSGIFGEAIIGLGNRAIAAQNTHGLSGDPTLALRTGRKQRRVARSYRMLPASDHVLQSHGESVVIQLGDRIAK